jgi:NAD(P)H dehydrogenase (quinone)
MKEKMLITSATGKTGFPTAVHLLNNGYPVRVFVRSRNASALELEKLGAEIAVGRYDNYNEVSNALAGIQRVYYCYPPMQKLVPNIRLFIQAAKENNIEAVVFMGQWLTEFDDQQSILANNIREAYTLLEQSGLNVIYFIPGFLADNFKFVLENAIQFGLMPSPLGGGINPIPSSEDMALVLYHLLINPAPFIGKRLRPTGPKSVSPHDIAATLSSVIGRNVIPLPLPEWMMIKALFAGTEEFLLDPFLISQSRHYFHENSKGKFNLGGVTTIVKDVTGKEPDDFETIARRWVDNSPYRERNGRNWLNALRKFVKIPMQPAPSIKELELLNR